MTDATAAASAAAAASSASSASVRHEPELLGQTVVVIGGSSGIGFETARRARAEGAEVILTGRKRDRLEQAALEIGARSTAAFDATDAAALARFFQDLPQPIDHVMVTAGSPHYEPLLAMDSARLRAALSDRVVLALEVARNAAGKVRPGGTLLFMGSTGARRISPGIASAADVAALAVHVMSNTALTGATYDVDGGEQFVL